MAKKSGDKADSSAQEFAQALHVALTGATTRDAFASDVLKDCLQWPHLGRAGSMTHLTVDWSHDVQVGDLSKELAGTKVLQIRDSGDGEPYAVFLIEFEHSAPVIGGHGWGLTTKLRQILKALVGAKKRGQPLLPQHDHDSILFICTNEYKHYRFCLFESPKDGKGQPILRSISWSHDAVGHTLLKENFRHLKWPAKSPAREPANWKAAWAKAFEDKAVTKAFYDEYKAAFNAFKDNHVRRFFPAGKEGEDECNLYAQHLLNRLFFLRFLEKKGWLTAPDGSTKYLASLYNLGSLYGDSFYRARLSKLFFHALCEENPKTRDQYREEVGTVPFLNGGLFEKTPRDELVTDIPDEAFAQFIGRGGDRAAGLFYRYNFTVEESTPLNIDVAVDPEMLGKVFEELVNDRNETGSFYTPRNVVAFMCKEALKGYLKSKVPAVPAAAIDAFVDHHDVSGERGAPPLTKLQAPAILDALRAVKAVDPACGSGAYLLGLMQELISLQDLLYNQDLIVGSSDVYQFKLGIIANNVYGVDINPFATDIAMLRLWLSLAVEADQPMALPNLDYRIVTGDSLTGPQPGGQPGAVKRYLTQARAYKEEYQNCHDTARKADLRKLIEVEYGEVYKATGIKREKSDKAPVIWDIAFSEVFGNGHKGFDIVLANPPYIRHEMISRDFKALLRNAHQGLFGGKSDLYFYFFSLASRISASNAVLVFVCSNSWLTSESGGALRAFLADHHSALTIYESEVERQFSTADVNTAITVAQKNAEAEHGTATSVRLVENLRPEGLLPESTTSRSTPMTVLARSGQDGSTRGSWTVLHSSSRGISDALLHARPGVNPMSELGWLEIRRGVRTGNDTFYCANVEALSGIPDEIRSRIAVPLLKSPTEIHKGHATSRADTTLFILDFGLSPEAWSSDWTKRRARSSGLSQASGWLRTMERGHLVAPLAIHDRFFVAANDADMAVHQRFTCFNLDNNQELSLPLLAMLNSSLMCLLVEVSGRKALGQGALDVPPTEWRKFFVPDLARLSIDTRSRLAQLGTQLKSATVQRTADWIESALCNAIDELVFPLFQVGSLSRSAVVDEFQTVSSRRLQRARGVA